MPILSTGGNNAGPDQTADGGLAQAEFAGDYVTSGADKDLFVGGHRLVLAGLFQQITDWDQSGFVLRFYNPGTPFINSLITINNEHYQDVTIVPAQTVTHDQHYGMSEVTLTFHSSGLLFDPTLTGTGNFTSTDDFEHNSAQYSVSLQKGAGTPIGLGAAAPDGQVMLCLPEGKYTLNSTVEIVNSGGGSSHNTLTPFMLDVPHCAKITVSNELQMTIANLPHECTANQLLHVAGSVASGTVVATIYYELNGGTPVTICNNCGISPSFAFDVLLANCDNTLKVTAVDANGNTTFVENTIHYDVTPPVLSGCQNILNAAPDGQNGAVVNYTVTALDNCDGAVAVNCVPPPGFFPIGQTTVTCTAVDRCGNIGSCQFTVTVEGSKKCPDLWVKLTATYPGPKLHHITGATTPCCGTNFIYHINYGNKGNLPVTGAAIEFLYPTACSLVSITQPSGCSATPAPFIPNTTGSCEPPFFPSSGLPEIFTLPTLNPSDHCNITVEVHLCCDIQMLCKDQEKLVAHVMILPLLPNDCKPGNNAWGTPANPVARMIRTTAPFLPPAVARRDSFIGTSP